MHCFIDAPQDEAIPLHLVSTKAFEGWLAEQPETVSNWLSAQKFKASSGKCAVWPGADGKIAGALLCHRPPSKKGPKNPGDHPIFGCAHGPMRLPAGQYKLATECDEGLCTALCLGWGLASYRFDRYRSGKGSRKKSSSDKAEGARQLLWPENIDRPLVLSTLKAIYTARELINTPAGDLGPQELGQALVDIGEEHGAQCEIIRGDELLQQGFPAIHAVGRAATRPPQLTDLRWGATEHPKLTLVGKGIIFDSGGLNIKHSSGMRLMKKDMGGAAAVIALAKMIMAANLPVRLRVLVPSAENAIAGNAFRPGDVLSTRKGVFVEIGNTDAEGRLILCDAIYEASQEEPDLIVDFATLTGAARVALGTELPALFCNDESLAHSIVSAGRKLGDPLWRMPLHEPYRRHLDSKVADLCNISKVGPGGAITAALYLREFIGDSSWVHIDTMGYNDSNRPGRPEGGEALGVRALFTALSQRYSV